MNIEKPGTPKPQGGRIADNIMHFARVLREAGVPAGPGAVFDALDAVQLGVIQSRDDFYWALHSIFVKRREHKVLFDQAFHVFWRKPKMLEQMMQMLFQQIRVETAPEKKQAGLRRLAEAMFKAEDAQSHRERPQDELELDSDFTFSADEVLRHRDFEQMTGDEERRARAAIARMRMRPIEIRTRRFAPARRGSVIDMRRTLKASLRNRGELVELVKRRRQMREPPLVVLLDISGSMSSYSRMLLHFLHALINDRSRVSVFAFGTRLTNITREIARRDIDEALEKVSAAVEDWFGGTRIGQCLREFNYQWSRRLLGQGAHVLLMSDGLDRDDAGELTCEMQRLRLAARRIVWLNPLLRYDGFEPRASGIRAIMPFVDEFRPVHNLDSLEELAAALSGTGEAQHDPRYWLGKSAAA
ncbi:MAG: vWA domain-containing protein [Aestuariivirgaceae bacterium]